MSQVFGLGWFGRAMAWVLGASTAAPLKRVEFIERPVLDIWPQSAVALVGEAILAAVAREPQAVAPPTVRPFARQLASQARLNRPLSRCGDRKTKLHGRQTPKPVVRSTTPKRAAPPPAAWMQARRSARPVTQVHAASPVRRAA